MSEPQPAFDTGNNLCALGIAPHIVTGYLRDWLTNRFADPNNIETEQLRGLLWKATQPTGILIESITKWKPEITVKCSLPNGELIEKTGKVYSEHKSDGFIIIYCE